MIRVHSYESMGIFDGPGLRLVVFLQGCRFRCLYCANPDTIPSVGGTLTDPEEIVQMARSMKSFFGKKGGVTFSGGEPTLQAAELLPLFRRLKEEGFHICLDTNGNNFNDRTRALYEYVDLVLLDVKQINSDRHRILTGHPNAQTLSTAAWLREKNIPMRIRYVLVPGYSDFEEDLHAFGKYFQNYENLERVELLPYHTFGVHKYESLGQPYLLKDVKEDSPERVEEVRDILKQYFKNVWTH